MTTRSHPALQIYTPDGNFIRAWDRPELFSETGPALFQNREARINLHYLRFDDDDNVWICHTTRHVVQKCNQDGDVLMTLGTYDEPGDDENHFNRPADMTITPAGVFIADGYGNRRIVHYSLDGRFIKTWGQQGINPGEFILPHGIHHDPSYPEGRLYVADRLNERVQVFDYEGNLLDIWRDLVMPWAILVTNPDEIWIAGSAAHDRANVLRAVNDNPSQLVAKFNADGRILQMCSFYVGIPYIARYVTGDRDFSVPGVNLNRPGDLNVLHDMAFDSMVNLYCATAGGTQLVQKYTPVYDMTTTRENGQPL
ncbi:hypothetical protein ACFL55_01930 [Candidatus Latescibacterota bacterium]